MNLFYKHLKFPSVGSLRDFIHNKVLQLIMTDGVQSESLIIINLIILNKELKVGLQSDLAADPQPV